MKTKISTEAVNNTLDDFETWWDKEYEYSLLSTGEAVHRAFKEIAKKAWEESVHNMIQNHNFTQNRELATMYIRQLLEILDEFKEGEQIEITTSIHWMITKAMLELEKIENENQ